MTDTVKRPKLKELFEILGFNEPSWGYKLEKQAIASFMSQVEQSAYERGVANTKFPSNKETPRYTKLLPIKRKRNGKTINK